MKKVAVSLEAVHTHTHTHTHTICLVNKRIVNIYEEKDSDINL